MRPFVVAATRNRLLPAAASRACLCNATSLQAGGELLPPGSGNLFHLNGHSKDAGREGGGGVCLSKHRSATAVDIDDVAFTVA